MSEVSQPNELHTGPSESTKRLMLDPNEQLIEFAKEIIRVAFSGGSLDGGDIQGMGVKYGLLREEGYDPEKHEENWDFEPGDPYFVFTSILSQYGDTHE